MKRADLKILTTKFWIFKEKKEGKEIKMSSVTPMKKKKDAGQNIQVFVRVR